MRLPPLLVLTFLLHPFAEAPAQSNAYGIREDAPAVADQAPWQEQEAGLPSYPLDVDLIELDLGTARASYRYLLDRASVAVGPDRVVRYTLVLAGPSGSRNVFHDGVRCATREYKGYAYGTGEGTFKERPGAVWEPLRDTGPLGFRSTLARHYLCDAFGSPLDVKEVLRRVQNKRPTDERIDTGGFPR